MSAKNRISSRDKSLKGGFGSEDSFLSSDSLGDGGWVLFSVLLLRLFRLFPSLLSDSGIGETAFEILFVALLEPVSV